MVSGNDPVESILKSIQVVFSPLEAGFKKATKEFELTWGKKDARNGEILGQLNGSDSAGTNYKNSKLHSPVSSKKKSTPSPCTLDEDKKKGPSIKLPIKTILGMLSPNCATVDPKDNVIKERSHERNWGKKDGSCVNCLQFAMTWSMFLNSFAQAFPTPFKFGKKRCSKIGDEEKTSCVRMSKSSNLHDSRKREKKEGMFVMMLPTEDTKRHEGKPISLELVVALIFDQITQNLQKLDQGFKQNIEKSSEALQSPPSSPTYFDHWKAVTSILEGKKADMNVFLGNLNFARVGGATSTLVGVTSPVNDEGDDTESASNSEESGGLSAQKLASGLLNIPLSNVERLKSTLSTVSISELIELLPQLGRSSKDIPDKKKLFSVQDFFRYTQAEDATSV